MVERGQPSTIKAVSNLLIYGGRNRHCLLWPWNKSYSLNESSLLSLYNWGSLWEEGWVCQGWRSLSTQAPCLGLKLGLNISWVLRTMQQKYTYLKRGGGWFFTVRRKRECWISHQWCLLHKETDYIEPKLITMIAQKRTDPGFYEHLKETPNVLLETAF